MFFPLICRNSNCYTLIKYQSHFIYFFYRRKNPHCTYALNISFLIPQCFHLTTPLIYPMSIRKKVTQKTSIKTNSTVCHECKQNFLVIYSTSIMCVVCGIESYVINNICCLRSNICLYTNTMCKINCTCGIYICAKFKRFLFLIFIICLRFYRCVYYKMSAVLHIQPF